MDEPVSYQTVRPSCVHRGCNGIPAPDCGSAIASVFCPLHQNLVWRFHHWLFSEGPKSFDGARERLVERD